MLSTAKSLVRYVRRFPDRLKYPRPSKSFVKIGSAYGGWWIETKNLSATSNILSAGVGEDVTFDLGLIESFNCHVVAIDPTPKAIEYIKQFEHLDKLRFYTWALAKTDGIIQMSPPSNSLHASYKVVVPSNHASPSFDFPARSLATILNQENWSHYDLLKMDIEGSEFSVIESIIEEKIDISQLCVEFHPEIAEQIGKTVPDVIKGLEDYGLKLVYKDFHNYTFLSQGLV